MEQSTDGRAQARKHVLLSAEAVELVPGEQVLRLLAHAAFDGDAVPIRGVAEPLLALVASEIERWGKVLKGQGAAK
jgi:hypothetical protein